MIQELLIKGVDHDQKPNKLPPTAPLDGSPSSSPSSTSAAAPDSLRCPRCDSSNTKFCYYNNYNLTQPRHFCKTCRRYWTKGGALRNVPIGGGCRKNKSASSIGAALGKSSPAKLKTLSSEMARTGLFTGFETAHQLHHHHHTLSSNPNLLWAPPNNNNNNNNTSSNHFISLLRANQNPNHNYPNHHQGSDDHHHHNNNNNHFRVSGLDPTLGPSPLFRNQTGQGLTHGAGSEAQYNGLQDLYQRLRSTPSTGCYFPAETNAPLIGNITSANYSSLANAAILETAPARTSDELGFWSANMNLSLPTHDVSTAANGAYPS